ncbi:MAG TPA: hypothetical protein VEZ11_02415 [Thermoanaerobaculia bacterium]|nr:hypothetical protein [Thermoanaerobaculia bacterium]
MNLLVLLIALMLAGVPPQDNPPTPRSIGYSAEPGFFLEVGVIASATLHDAKRNKDLDVAIEYPKRFGPYPVIIFSHGLGGSKKGYDALTEYWVSHGYVCIKPSHADAGKLRSLRDAEELLDSQSADDFVNRAKDISLIIDSLPGLEQRFPELKGRIDATRVGVGGHSYGALTTMMIAGAKSYANGQPLEVADDRPRAAIAMSPQGISAKRGLRADSWTGIRMPMLFMTGTLDRGPGPNETPEWRRDGFSRSPAGDKYLVVLQGARHMSFTGLIEDLEDRSRDREERSGSDYPMHGGGGGHGIGPLPHGAPPPVRDRIDPDHEKNIMSRIKVASLVFWDIYLKGRTEAKPYLVNQVEKNGGVQVFSK